MAYVGEYVGQWVGEWLGQALNPGAMYANISGSGGAAADADALSSGIDRGGAAYPQLTVYHGRKDKTREDRIAERKKLGIHAELEKTKDEIRAAKKEEPQPETEQYYQHIIYLALLEEELARLKAMLVLAIAEEAAMKQALEEEQAIVILMMGLAA